ncbi:MAG TPA: PAS-domain containing protein, partial [Pseudolabrys sp.]|nr:PAS-domain containing protein [Pseudolabrys sp.]
MAYLSELDLQTYAVVVAAVLATIAYAFVRLRRRGDGALLSMVLNNMTQGVVLFDAHERVLVVNDRYVEMYGLSSTVVKPGCTLAELIENRITTGSLNIDPDKYRAEIMAAVREGTVMNRIVETPDGRAVLVVNRPIKSGQYWIGTHDDITERIQAERKSVALSEQERRRVVLETEIRDFRESSAAVLRTVSESTAALNSIAGALSNSSGLTSDRAASAVQTTNEASANMIAAAGA